MQRFTKSFTQQESLSEQAISAAVEVMRTGRLHRYNTIDGEASETDLLETEFAAYMGSEYCLSCASGGYAIQLALRACGIEHASSAENPAENSVGKKVLSNAFTLAPVPGAIDACGGVPVLVEMDENCCIDLDDLALKAQQSQAKVLLLSHMRGHIADMDRIMQICEQFDLTLIEDCAHTMGAHWNGRLSGSFGDFGCFSTQTYKHLNSGEGGLLVSNRADLMSRAIVQSGSYMFFDQHHAGPASKEYTQVKLDTANYSGRMDNLRAAILRPQLTDLDTQCARWNERYSVLEQGLSECRSIRLTDRPKEEKFVASSIQLFLPNFSELQVVRVVEDCAERGVALKWFGDPEPKGYTSRFDSWRYLAPTEGLEQTQSYLATLLDMRIPLTFDLEDCQLIAKIITDVVAEVDTAA